MKHTHIYSILIIILFSCNSKSETSLDDNNHKIIETDTHKVNKLLKEAVNDGNLISYKKAASIYFDENRYSEFYFYATMMANKHNCSRAYYDLYVIMNRKGQRINDIEMYSDDKETSKLSNYFLIKSYELGLKEAKPNLEDIFGGNIPLSKDYLCK